MHTKLTHGQSVPHKQPLAVIYMTWLFLWCGIYLGKPSCIMRKVPFLCSPWCFHPFLLGGTPTNVPPMCLATAVLHTPIRSGPIWCLGVLTHLPCQSQAPLIQFNIMQDVGASLMSHSRTLDSLTSYPGHCVALLLMHAASMQACE
jgi:hypothetical protein